MKSVVPVSLAVLLSSGCTSHDSQAPMAPSRIQSETRGAPHARDKFPAGFLWGTAVAGFQVDMGCPTVNSEECEDRNSDWHQYITTERIVGNPLLFMSKEPPSRGPGFYELYKQDLEMAARDLGNNSFRLSIEWSRLFKKPTFGARSYEDMKAMVDTRQLAWYHDLFKTMKEKGLKPFVTVSHYSLPLWIHSVAECNKDYPSCPNKGWADDRIVGEISKYAMFLGREFGGEVDLWSSMNEPFSAVIIPGYVIPSKDRTNPPGLYYAHKAGKIAMKHMIEAHARIYDALKANDGIDADGDGEKSSVGIVYCPFYVEPLTSNDRDAVAAEDARYFWNDMFLQGVAKGLLDEEWDGNVVGRPDLARRLDFLGVNYYTAMKAQDNLVDLATLRGVSKKLTFNFFNQRFNMFHPEGIYPILKEMQRKYNVPMYISETGTDLAGDPRRGEEWAVKTLGWVRQAIEDGVVVKGYYYWSLIDNYEWNHGSGMKFGLWAVDPTDPQKKRVKRGVADVYGRISSERRIPADLAEKYGL